MSNVAFLNPHDAKPAMSVEAEQMVIGQILLSPEGIGRIVRAGGADLFADPLHREIFEAAQSRANADALVSPVTINEALRASPLLNQVGAGYIARMAGAAPGPSSFKGLVDLLADLRRKRIIQAAMSEASAAIAQGKDSAALVAGRLEAAMLAATEGDTSCGPVSMLRAVGLAMQQVASAYRGEADSFVRTGIESLDHLITGLFPGELVLIGGRPSMGKAQPFDAMIKTLTGWKRMGDVEVGDELASVDGGPSRIMGVFPQGQRQVFRVTFSDGRSTRCCGEHLWRVDSCKFSGGRVLSTYQIAEMIGRERYRRRLYVPLATGDFGASENLPIDPWLLGALIGNGSMSASGVSLHDMHAETIDRAKSVMPDGHSLKHYGAIEYGISSDRGKPNVILEALDVLGLRGCRSHEKFIPEIYLDSSLKDRLNLLRGLMDTDGWVESFGAIRYSTSSPKLAHDVQRLVRSVGGICSVSEKEVFAVAYGDRRQGLPHFVLNIRHQNPESLVSLKKKQDRCARKKSVRLTVVSVDPDGFEDVQCIAVSHPSRLYLTDDYIATHNTGVALSMALNAARAGHHVCIASLEMNPEAMALRALSEATGQAGHAVTYSQMRRGEMAQSQVDMLTSQAEAVANLPITFLPRHFSDIGALLAGAKQAHRAAPDGLKLLVVDYAQLLRSQARSRYEQITEISIALKALAGQLNVPVVALSQLSRAVESREDKRPTLADLRESGQLEQDADAVLFCYRDAYYVERMRPADDAPVEDHDVWKQAMDRARNRLEIIVAKQRQGEIGTAHCMFNPALNLIWEGYR